jgi:KaiC/GvpD/RAD55 family RecA-like ATPase
LYVDDLNETQTVNLQPITITVNPPQPRERAPDKIFSGTPELDLLLLGGIPEKQAVALTSPSNDEKELLITRFLEAGTDQNETTVYLAVDAGGAKALVDEHPSNFYLFVCNPRADAMIKSLPNVFKFRGVENLTDIDIALAKVFRKLDQSKPALRRACIDIVSDVLLLHHPVITRKWLSGLLADLRAKGFTTLATINPTMHPSEEVQAVLSLFEGEIDISEIETAGGAKRVLRVRKFSGQKYSEDELVLSR